MHLPSIRTALGFLLSLSIAACSAIPDEDVGETSDDITAQDKPEILALGDSITFGWDPLLEPKSSKVDEKRYVGYPELIAKKNGWRSFNTSCPGEASASLLKDGEDDNGCDGNRAAFDLHASWGKHEVQIDAVQEHLRSAVAANRAPALVTMTIGGNDLGLLEKSCKSFFAPPACMAAKLPLYAHNYENNLQATIDALAATGYQGKVVILTTYAPDFSDPIARIALSLFNEQVRDAIRKQADDHPDMHVVAADAYAAFKAEADKVGGKTCETGLLIKNPDGTCDIHPSRKGQELLARTVLEASR